MVFSIPLEECLSGTSMTVKRKMTRTEKERVRTQREKRGEKERKGGWKREERLWVDIHVTRQGSK